MIWIILGLSTLSAALYRAGGTGGKWYLNTKTRDMGCSLVNIVTCLCLGLKVGLWATAGAYFLMFGLLWTSFASYWGQDEKKWGFWAHGLGLSLAVLPVAFITGNWAGFAIRTVVLTTFTALWSEFWGSVEIEESGRGFLANATLPLLLIG